jgi:FkbM family methyltransferase
MRLNVSPDLYGSSFFATEAFHGESLEVPVTTVDALARSKEISGRGFLKLDVQFAEHLVLAGAQEFLSQIDLLVLELTSEECPKERRTFLRC